MLIVSVTAIVVVAAMALTVIWLQSRLMTVISKPQVDVSLVVRDVLDRFVEQSKVSSDVLTGVYAPVEPPSASPAPFVGFEDGPRMVSLADFDDSDPTDEYLRPVRSAAVVVEPGDDSPFGVPGLTYMTRKDDPLTIADILGTGYAPR